MTNTRRLLKNASVGDNLGGRFLHGVVIKATLDVYKLGTKLSRLESQYSGINLGGLK